MACHSRGGDYGGAAPSDVAQSTKSHSSDSVAEWRSREQLEPSPPSTSPAYWDSDDEDDSNSSSIVGPKPSELYGKFTWKIENFSEISKRELRSNIFEVGGYKWYILVYPQGCDVCNHLSLFLCVADYDKLLPGWSHFAQFTIAVVNKDPKKSKYSDTLHRFCKKEHDWGWKKFMELSKVLDGFTVADTLVIKAQVQVIRENPHRPFRCLDCQYRRELVRVYLTNVEGICRRFVEEKREKLGKLMEDASRWASFRTFWTAVEEGSRHRLAREKTDVILKAVVKRFFNEKEVTSTLVMDALYSGCKALDYRTKNKKGKINGVEMEEAVSPVVWVEKDSFVLAGDVLVLLERAVGESLPPYKDDKGPQNRTKDVGSGDDFGKDSVERDERRLTELGRRTVEMFVLAHLYTNRVEVAYREAVALKRQEELIREEEAAGQAETEMRIKREAAEKEKRSKKKQAKQRRRDRKEKDKEAEEKKVRVEQEQRQRQDHSSNRVPKENLHKERELSPLVSAEAGEDEDDLSGLDPIDDVVGTLGPAIEDGDTDRVGWEREASHAQNGMEAGFSGALLEDTTRNRRRKPQATVDDSSSTCSSDSLPSVRAAMNESFVARPTLPEQSHVNHNRNGGDNEMYDTDGQYLEADGMRAAGLDVNGTGEPSSSTSSVGVDSETVILSLTDRVRWLEQRLIEKEEEVVILQEQLSLLQHQMEHDRPSRRQGEEATDISSGVRNRDVVSADEGRGETSTSFIQSDGSSFSELDKVNSSVAAMHGPTQVNGHSGFANGNVGATRSPYSGGLAVNDNRNSSYAQGPCKLEPVRNVNVPSRSKSVDSSRPPRVLTPPMTGFSAAVSGSVAVPEEQNVPHPPPSTSAGIGVSASRPSSAPGLVAGSRPNIPVASSSMHTSQPLARSMSVGAGRPTVGMESTTSLHTNGMPMQSPPVTPSYKNATMNIIGKTRSFSGTGFATHPMNSHPSISGTISGTLSGASTSSYMSSSSLQVAPQAIAPPTASLPSSSPPLTPTPIVRSVPGQATILVANGTKGEGAMPGTPAESTALLSQSSATESIAVSHIMREISGNGGSSSGHPSVGFTFGTVTPELFQEDQLELPPPLEQPQHDDQSQQLKEIQQQQQGSHRSTGRQTIAQQMLHQHRSQGSSAETNGGPGISSSRSAPSGVAVLESVHNGAVMSEEFPHLDIINDLLDEDPNLGMALKMLQSSHNPGYSQIKLHYGQNPSDRVNSLGGDGGDRSRENEEERPNGNGLRENLRLSPFQHPSLALHSLQHAHAPYWPIASQPMPSGHNSNGRNGLVDSHLPYSLVQGHHLAVPDFSLGHNGYTVYPHAQQP